MKLNSLRSTVAANMTIVASHLFVNCRLSRLLWIYFGVIVLSAPRTATATALDTYVATADPSYAFLLDSTVTAAGLTGYNINLTSQTWRDPSEVTQNVWTHKLTVAVPSTLASNPAKNTAILVIEGGSNPGSFEPVSASSLLGQVALLTNSVVVDLPTIPNQPLQFAGEAFTRKEDEIIAKSFAKFLDGGDSQWPVLLPMVKSAVRAMDAAQDYLKNQQGIQIDKFFIIGGSKRGWTTWLTAAVDNRVSGIVPGSIDMLNLDESMAHHRQVYQVGPTPPTDCSPTPSAGCSLLGGYSTAVDDYVLENVMDRLATPRGQELLSIVDPYEYRARLNMPKYILNSTGDEFFVPDSSQFYFKDLVGPKYLRYVPNTSHALNDNAITGAVLFEKVLAQGVPLPQFNWVVSPDGTSITLNTVDTPAIVKLWQATNLQSRDFRLETFGANWTSTILSPQSLGQYIATLTAPASGSRAFMIELTYNMGGAPLVFTTDVSVIQIPEPAGIVLLLVALSIGVFRRGRNGCH